MADRTPLLVFADDWGRHPSSCQHLVSRLLPRREVVWVNTIGMRPPRLDLATARRGLEKARQWLRPAPPAAASASTNPRVLNPRMWPWIASRLDRALNARLLRRQLLPALASLPTPPVAVTTVPVVADLVGELPVARWVYYCVDDFGSWPGLDHGAVQRMEVKLVRKADAVVAVSETLCDRVAGMGKAATLLTHGVDIDFWAGVSAASPRVAKLPRPLAVFWGVVDRRMDVDIVRAAASAVGGGTVALAGPLNDPDPELFKVPNVVSLGPLPMTELPALARAADVLVMPYADLPVTRAIQPLKLKEYLATGRPVVVRDLPATRGWADCLDLAATPAAFADAVRSRVRTGLPAGQAAARGRLVGESWDAKAAAFAGCLADSAKEAVPC